ncbi:MAG TPA: cytochrome d ubiquinol oxidase subunit II [Usitatibacter sp.]|jgi:cytochrome d ubiquinol oxidase subunit II|nr:cytochrome d ubiquinol oxidase subunit II [Usitatibacter sp.]
MALDLVPLWTAILAFGVFMYVLLDGFDLGVGILFPLAHGVQERSLMMNSIAPIWDFNETWLVLGGVGLLAAFPIAFAIIIPAVYFPILFMLVGLIFRGVAFEFSHLAKKRAFWSGGFFVGSLVATFSQGVVLGTYVQGIPVSGRAFVGGSFDWLTPFALLTGLGLIAGYGLLGACWLVMKTEGELQAWARRMARGFTIGVAAFVAMVSVWTPLLEPQVRSRWFGGDHPFWLWPVPLVTAGLFVWLWRSIARGHFAPFLAGMGIFLMAYIGLGISIFPLVVPYTYDLWQSAASPSSQAFLMIGTLFLLPIILGYTVYSYYVFRGKVQAGTGYGHAEGTH